MASRGSIKAGTLRPGDKPSCDHCQSREPGMTCNDYGKVLEKKHASCGTIFVDHASDLMHHSMQTSVEEKQTVEAKHNFEVFSRILVFLQSTIMPTIRFLTVKLSKKVA